MSLLSFDLSNRTKRGDSKEKNTSSRKRLTTRDLRMEPLEERALLAVTTADFVQLQTMYPDIAWGNLGDYTVYEIDQAWTTANDFAKKVEAANTAKGNHLFLFKTDSITTLKLSEEIDLVGNQGGKIIIASLYGGGDDGNPDTAPLPYQFKSMTLQAPDAAGSRLVEITGSSYNSNGLTNFSFAGLNLTGGHASGNGGAILQNSPSATVYCSSVSFTSNTATGNGGAVSLAYGKGVFNNTLFIGNVASGGQGGGLFSSGNTLGTTLTNTTFAKNTAGGSRAGGGAYFAGPISVVTNGIFYGNTGAAESADIYMSSTTGNSYSKLLYEKGDFSSLTGDKTQTTVSPFVDLVQNNFKLAAGSVAIDAGVSVSLARDVEGNARIQGTAVDLGAYETTPFVDLALNEFTSSVAVFYPGQSVTFNWSLKNAGAQAIKATDAWTLTLVAYAGDTPVSTITKNYNTFAVGAVINGSETLVLPAELSAFTDLRLVATINLPATLTDIDLANNVKEISVKVGPLFTGIAVNTRPNDFQPALTTTVQFDKVITAADKAKLEAALVVTKNGVKVENFTVAQLTLAADGKSATITWGNDLLNGYGLYNMTVKGDAFTDANGNAVLGSVSTEWRVLSTEYNEWIGAANGDWFVGANWSYGHVPTVSEKALIDAGESVVLAATGATATQIGSSIICNGNLSVSGNVNFTGSVLTVNAGGTFAVTGDASIVKTTINQQVDIAGTLIVNATGYASNLTFGNQRSNTVNISGTINVLAGGLIFDGMANISGSLNNKSGAYTYLYDTTEFTGSLNLTGGLFQVGYALSANRTIDVVVSGATSISGGAGLRVASKSSLALPNLTSYTKGAAEHSSRIQVDSNATLDMSNVTTWSNPEGANIMQNVFLSTGATLNLSKLNSLDSMNLNFVVYGTGVTLDISGLTDTSVQNARFTLGEGTTILGAEKITSMENGIILAGAADCIFSGITSVKDVALIAVGGTLSLPNLLDFTSTGTNNSEYDFSYVDGAVGVIIAADAGGTLNLPKLNNVVVSGENTNLVFIAGDGGQIQLDGLWDLNTGNATLTADGEGSLINAPVLYFFDPDEVAVNQLNDGIVALPTDIADKIVVDINTDTVVAGDGKTSIREAIDLAKTTGKTIIFDPALGDTITLLGGALVIDANMKITGPGSNLLTLSGKDSRVFEINGTTPTATINVSISGLSVDNGTTPAKSSSGGGIYALNTHLTLSGMAFHENIAVDRGGAVYLNGGSLTLVDSYFHKNSAIFGGAVYVQGNTSHHMIQNVVFVNNGSLASTGGTIYQYDGKLSIIDCTAIDNVAMNGSVLAQNPKVAETIVSGSTFKNNTAAIMGGAFALVAPTTISTSLFEGNIAKRGGAIYQSESASTIKDHVVFKNNSTTVLGGAIALMNSEMTITDTSFILNKTLQNDYGRGGAFYQEGANANSTFGVGVVFGGKAGSTELGNSGGRGGAIAIMGGNLTVNSGAQLIANSAIYGGGIYFQSNGTNSITGASFADNKSSYDGAGLFQYSGNLNISNTTLSNNVATKLGGGLVIGTQVASVDFGELNNFTGNKATDGGGIFFYDNKVAGTSKIDSSVTFTGNITTNPNSNAFTLTLNRKLEIMANDVVIEELTTTNEAIEVDETDWLALIN